MGNTFGVIPLSPLMLYQGPRTNNASASDIPDSKVRRTIVDLSWPKNFSVNAGVMKDKYWVLVLLNYPSVDDIVEKIVELGPGSLLYKVDIS